MDLLSLLFALNSVRTPKLVISPALNAVAQARCVNLKEWSHAGIEKDVYSKVLSKKVTTTGENLAYGTDATTTVANWEWSPGHKANNQNKSFTKVGFGVCDNKTITKIMGGNTQWTIRTIVAVFSN
jgi:uncharacterized protein YkwD